VYLLSDFLFVLFLIFNISKLFRRWHIIL